jgi:carbamoyl-phosphate synthase large subunit
MGFADSHIGRLLGKSPKEIREMRKKLGLLPTFQRVDTCAAEFEAQTPYLYSAYEMDDESRSTDKQKILILGGGPNRIGQGIEFDYCCCQAAFALSKMGYETIMYNCNPETVSTDYDTADRLYFEPLTLEHVMNVIDREQPVGVIVQFGGQTPLNLSAGLKAAGVYPGDFARSHPAFGGPRGVCKTALETGNSPAGERNRPFARASPRSGSQNRVSGFGAALVRVGRAGHGSRPE